MKIYPVTLPMLCFCFSLPLLSCGSDSKDSYKGGAVVSEPRENGMTFAAESDLPTCDAERDGFLVYVKETANFRTCVSGKWEVIDLKGSKGEKGEVGAAAADTISGVNLYKKYKHSIFRVELSCSLQANPAGACVGEPANVQFTGTAFLCGDKSVCTNNHVVNCSTCYDFESISLQAVVGNSDSVNPNGEDGGSAAPFFTTTSNAAIKLHSAKDLARFPITTNPPNSAPLPISAKLANEVVTPLMSILSISYPLGFQDLYVDIGSVNSPKLGQCEPGDPKYGCPAEYYAFSTTNDTDHGSSGSPLIDMATGEVVGLTTAGTEGENANYTWATDASYLKDIE